MWALTIISFLILTATLFSFYRIVRKTASVQKHFFLKQFIIQSLLLVLSLFLFYILALSGSGHHVDTDTEKVLGELMAYIFIGSSLINIVALIILLIKSIKNNMVKKRIVTKQNPGSNNV